MDQEKTFLTEEECQALAKAMDDKYRIALNGRNFYITCSLEGDGVKVEVLLKNEEQSFYYPVQGRIMHEAEEMSAGEGVLFLVDYIDIYFEEFLLEEEETLYLPIDWKDFEYEAVNFQLKGQIKNQKLEAMADKLLGDEFETV